MYLTMQRRNIIRITLFFQTKKPIGNLYGTVYYGTNIIIGI